MLSAAELVDDSRILVTKIIDHQKIKKLLTRLSPISHLVTSEEFFDLETLIDDLGVILRDSPNNELDFRFCKHLIIFC